MSISAQELDDLYTHLCYRLTEKGDAAIADVLARLSLLLIHEVDDATKVRRAIEAALEGFPDVSSIDRPL
jgi:hypothetical protein